jgi:succinate-acetate transporter protein
LKILIDHQTQDAASLDQILKFDYIDFHCHKFTNPEPLGAASLDQILKFDYIDFHCHKFTNPEPLGAASLLFVQRYLQPV